MKYLGKLLLEGIVITLVAGLALFIIIYFLGERIIELIR